MAFVEYRRQDTIGYITLNRPEKLNAFSDDQDDHSAAAAVPAVTLDYKIDRFNAAAEVGALRRDQLRQMIEPFLPRAEGALRPAEVAQLLAQRQVSLVDLRDPPVYARMHLPGAVNIPLAEVANRLAELHMLPAEPVLYDRAGEQAKELAGRLASEGTPVAFLDGGVLAWEAEGLPVERPD